MTIKDDLMGFANQAIASEGVQIWVKTDFGPSVKVYDSDDPPSDEPSIIKYGVEVRDRSGAKITGYGEMPETNPIKFIGVILLMGLGVMAAVRIGKRAAR